jgi:hypothetical protein
MLYYEATSATAASMQSPGETITIRSQAAPGRARAESGG